MYNWVDAGWMLTQFYGLPPASRLTKNNFLIDNFDMVKKSDSIFTLLSKEFLTKEKVEIQHCSAPHFYPGTILLQVPNFSSKLLESLFLGTF